jgi:hypothetical protein
MLERTDRMFFTNEWEAIFPNHLLHSLAPNYSNLAPLILKTDARFAWKKMFSLSLILDLSSWFLGCGQFCMALSAPRGKSVQVARLAIRQHSPCAQKLE